MCNLRFKIIIETLSEEIFLLAFYPHVVICWHFYPSNMDFARPKDGWTSLELDISNTVCNALQKKGTANLKVLKYGICLQKYVNMAIRR